MAKITVSKTVYWNDAGREATGKVKQILQDHAVVESPTGRYIIQISKLSLKSMNRHASGQTRIITTGGADGI